MKKNASRAQAHADADAFIASIKHPLQFMLAAMQSRISTRGVPTRQRGDKMSNVTRGRWTGSRKLGKMGT